MSSTYSTSLLLELIGTGEQAGTWGTTTNRNLGTLLEQAITGVITLTMSNTDYTMTSLPGASDEARNAVIVVSGTGPTSSTLKKVIAPNGTDVTKTYTVFNNTSSGYPIAFGGATGAYVTIPNGTAALVYGDGVDFYSISNSNNITGSLTLTGALYATQPVASISYASPTVVTLSTTDSGLVENVPIFFSLGDAAVMPTGLTANTIYYVKDIATGGGATTFNVSATPGGAAINTSTANVGDINVVSSTPSAISSFTTARVDNTASSVSTARQYPALLSANTTASQSVATADVLSYNAGYPSTTNTGALNVGTLTSKTTATITIATPGVVTTTQTMPDGTPVFFETTGALPTGITAGTTYYAVNPSGSTFQIAATAGGSAIATSGSQSGVHTVYYSNYARAVNGRSGDVSVPQLNALSVVADGSNNLNISLSPTTLSFRSGTLSSGAVTTVTTTSATTLTVPAGATLGAITGGTPCTIAILAFYSGGSVILGVQNIWGDFIDESQLKSATAISTASDDTNAYASSSVTSVPYRVVGYFYYSSAPIPVGNWSTNPTTVQSTGGLILTQGLGMGAQTWSASSASVNTVLRNANPFPICVAVACSASFYVAVGPSTPTVTVAGSATGGANDVVNFIVPPGNTFEIYAAGGTSVLTYSLLR